ncbi:MAG TPA: hypothetical protein VM223_09015 [Planctomycetota bacterium]|nr:hypothetical protein [Planctomycetota bacterium]
MTVSALAQLREQIDIRDQARAAEQAKQNAAQRQDFLDTVTKILGPGVAGELNTELSPQYMKVILHYRGHSWQVECRDINRQNAGILPARVAKWTRETDEKIATFEAEQEVARAKLPEIIAGCGSPYTLNAQRKEAEKYHLLDDPGIKAALDTRQIVLERAAADAEAREQAAEQSKLQELIDKANAATGPDDLYDLKSHRLRGNPEARAAIAAAKERVKQAEAKREAKRDAAEQAAFYPFRVYRVHYGVAVVDDDGGVYADTDTIYSATVEPDIDGFYHPLNGSPVLLRHIVKIEKLDIIAAEDMRSAHIGQHQETEWGGIRVPSPGCERLATVTVTATVGGKRGG